MRLSQWLGEELPATFLLDYPSVRELATEVDKLLAKNQNGVEHSDAPAEAATIDVDLLLQARGDFDTCHLPGEYLLRSVGQVQEKLKKTYSLPQNQKKISNIAAKHPNDKTAYAKAIEPFMAEVEAGRALHYPQAWCAQMAFLAQLAQSEPDHKLDRALCW